MIPESARRRVSPITADFRCPHEMRSEVAACLQKTGHLFSRAVSCEYDQGVLVLRGRVPSFYLKQLAQERVTSLDGISKVVNQIEVVGQTI
jgi:osmotically-inducible protein OsmY